MADIHYHIGRPGPRSRYALAHVLGAMAGWEAKEVADLEQFGALAGPKLHYGTHPVEGAFHVVPHGFLEQTGTTPMEPPTGVEQGVPVLFPARSGHLPFDPFAAAFYMLSRYEEYGPVQRDEHGRPVTASLHAARHGYLDRPVVDEWLFLLVGAWRVRDPRLPELRRIYTQTATLDADNGAMYLGRPLWRSMGGAIRDLLRGKPGRVLDRAKVLLGKAQDPYTVHEAFMDLAALCGGEAIINFLVAAKGEHDHAIDVRTPYMRHVVAQAGKRSKVGLHPGYASADNPAQCAVEQQLLEDVLGMPVVRSRQHFLRMRLPETYRQLAQLGIREEHSMGLADKAGFRAGTCTPFPFFDLGENAQTALTVFPFAVMDSALCYKLKLSPKEAVEEASRMADAVRNVRGRFISVWHERFLSGYGVEQGWEVVAKAVLEHARP